MKRYTTPDLSVIYTVQNDILTDSFLLLLDDGEGEDWDWSSYYKQ